jgi:opacity protein-like surface antigen
MGTRIALIIATLAAACATSGAKAADLLPPPPPIEAPPPGPCCGSVGWYLRGDVGVGALQMSDWRSTLQPYDETGQPFSGTLGSATKYVGDQGFAGGGVGYQFNSWFRADLTGEYRTDANYHAYIPNAYNNGTCANGTNCLFAVDSYNANIGSTVFLANGYLDLCNCSGITPFVGFGVGFAAHRFTGLTDIGLGASNGGYGVAPDASPVEFAWAAMAGLGFNITPNLKLEIGYRYLDMGRLSSNPIQCANPQGCFLERHSFNLASNDVRLGFRYLIGGPVVAPIPGPIVSKY